jgi:hypothetical protein
MANLTMVMDKVFEGAKSIAEMEEDNRKAAENAIVIDVMQMRRGFDSSLCPLLLQYMEEDQKEGEDMLIAVSFAAAECGHKDVSKEEFEWLKQFKLRNDHQSYKIIALSLYKDGTIDKDVLSIAYRHSKNQKEFSSLAANLQASINNLKEEQEA